MFPRPQTRPDGAAQPARHEPSPVLRSEGLGRFDQTLSLTGWRAFVADAVQHGERAVSLLDVPHDGALRRGDVRELGERVPADGRRSCCSPCSASSAVRPVQAGARPLARRPPATTVMTSTHRGRCAVAGRGCSRAAERTTNDDERPFVLGVGGRVGPRRPHSSSPSRSAGEATLGADSARSSTTGPTQARSSARRPGATAASRGSPTRRRRCMAMVTPIHTTQLRSDPGPSLVASPPGCEASAVATSARRSCCQRCCHSPPLRPASDQGSPGQSGRAGGFRGGTSAQHRRIRLVAASLHTFRMHGFPSSSPWRRAPLRRRLSAAIADLPTGGHPPPSLLVMACRLRNAVQPAVSDAVSGHFPRCSRTPTGRSIRGVGSWVGRGAARAATAAKTSTEPSICTAQRVRIRRRPIVDQCSRAADRCVVQGRPVGCEDVVSGYTGRQVL